MTQETTPNQTISSVDPTVFINTTESLNKKILELDKELKEAKSNFEKSRFDLITILSIFVGLITYLGLEIQVFKIINNPLLIIGISIFFIASILLFVITVNLVLKKEIITFKDFVNPLYIILIILFILSISFILCGYKDFYQKNIITEDFHKK